MTKHRSRFSIFNAIIIYFIFLTKTLAQPGTGENHYNYSFGINTFKGFVMPHNEGVRHLAYGRPTGTEMYFNWASDGSKPWHHRYGFPEAGVSLTYFNTDMPPTGNLWSAMTYMDLFLVKKSYLQVTFRIGTGLTYSKTLYNQENNNLNVMISSPISYNMQGRIGLRFPVHDRFYIDSGLTLSHASNGAVVLPNSGINMVTANFGLAYRFKPMELMSEPEAEEINEDIGFDFLFSATLRDPVRNQGRLYPFYTIRVLADKTFNHVSRVSAGFDFFFNYSRKVLIRRDPDLPDDTDFKRIALVVGHELMVSRVSLVTQVGYYLYQPYLEDGDPNFYQRYGLRYYFRNEWYGSYMLKAHGGVADNFALGVGKRF